MRSIIQGALTALVFIGGLALVGRLTIAATMFGVVFGAVFALSHHLRTRRPKHAQS